VIGSGRGGHLPAEPVEIHFTPQHNRDRDDLGDLIRVESPNTRLQRGVARAGGLELTLPLVGLIQPSLPPEPAGHRAQHLGAGREPFVDGDFGDRSSEGFGRGRDGDGQAITHEGILVSSPVLPSAMGTMAVRQPLLNVTTSRLPSGSAVISVTSPLNFDWA